MVVSAEVTTEASTEEATEVVSTVEVNSEVTTEGEEASTVESIEVAVEEVDTKTGMPRVKWHRVRMKKASLLIKSPEVVREDIVETEDTLEVEIVVIRVASNISSMNTALRKEKERWREMQLQVRLARTTREVVSEEVIEVDTEVVVAIAEDKIRVRMQAIILSTETIATKKVVPSKAVNSSATLRTQVSNTHQLKVVTNNNTSIKINHTTRTIVTQQGLTTLTTTNISRIDRERSNCPKLT